MIKSVRLTNFFSFRNCEITLEPDVTVLVGINGSGKTNLLRAFELLKAGMEGTLKEKIADWGGLESVICKGQRNKLRTDDPWLYFALASNKELPFKVKGDFFSELKYSFGLVNHPPSYFVTAEKLSSADNRLQFSYATSNGAWIASEGLEKDEADSVSVDLYPGNLEGEPSREVVGVKKLSRGDTRELFLSHVNPDAFNYGILERLLHLRGKKELALYSDFDTRSRSPMRQAIQATGLDVLDSDGANLFQILNTIQLKSTEAGDAIERDLRSVNPNFDRLQFQPLGQGGMLTYLREVGLKTPIPAAHVSDGTLRFLCLLAIAHNPDRGRLICLDEPERGLHPDMLAAVARLLLQDGHAAPEAPRHTGYVVATHSPQLLSHFPLRCLRIFEKDENNQTIVRQFSDDDGARFREWYEAFDPGSLWLKGELGGTRW